MACSNCSTWLLSRPLPTEPISSASLVPSCSGRSFRRMLSLGSPERSGAVNTVHQILGYQDPRQTERPVPPLYLSWHIIKLLISSCLGPPAWLQPLETVHEVRWNETARRGDRTAWTGDGNDIPFSYQDFYRLMVKAGPTGVLFMSYPSSDGDGERQVTSIALFSSPSLTGRRIRP